MENRAVEAPANTEVYNSVLLNLLQSMVLVPAGSFVMGCREDEFDPDLGYPDNPELDGLWWSKPQRRVYLDAYLIDRYPVTNLDYKAFIDATGYAVPVADVEFGPRLASYSWDTGSRTFPDGLQDYPVVFVTWYDALAYCEWKGKSLPTEAQWEKAARGIDAMPFPWGADPDVKRYCRCFEESEPSPFEPREDMRPVTAYPEGRSPLGCFDMLGNAGEWCRDRFIEEFYSIMPSMNPVAQGPANLRSLRGSGRYHFPPHVARRYCRPPWHKSRGDGFRCACELNRLTAPLEYPPED